MALKYVQTNTLFNAGAGNIIGATSVTLSSFTDIYGNVLTMADFGTKGYGTEEPDTTNEEGFTFTGVTANANGTYTLTGVSTVLAKSPYTETSGLVRQHSGGTKVVITDNVGFWNTFTNKNNDETVTGQWTFTNTPIVPGVVSDASTTVKGVSKLSVAPVLASNPIAVGDNDPRIVSPFFSGFVTPLASRTIPSTWLLCDGSAVTRTGLNASLFSFLCPSGTFTVTIASPAVFTKTTHGYVVGDKVHLTTTGALPTGLATNTDYYISTVVDVNTFQVALSPGGPAVNTSGSQSGAHTVYLSAYGKGDGSTTFNLPDFRGRNPMSVGQSSYSVAIDNTKVTLATPSVFTIPGDTELYQGQAIVLTTSGALPTGFTSGSTYYVIRASQTATTFSLASSQTNANSGTGIAGSGSQSGIHTLTYTLTSNRTIIGRVGGEEMHGVSQGELANHDHRPLLTNPSGGSGNPVLSSSSTSNNSGFGSSVDSILRPTPVGNDTQHNNMSPFLTVGGWIIKQ